MQTLYDPQKRLAALRAANEVRAAKEREAEAQALMVPEAPAPAPMAVEITPMVLEEGRRLNTAELQSRQILSAEGESRAIALGQESFLSGSPGRETWVTDLNTETSRTLAEWVSTIGTSTMLVSAIDPPTPDPTIDGAQWFDPSTGDVSVWYDGAWVSPGVPAPTSPTPATEQAATVTVGPVALLIKLLDLPVPYFDGGQSYYAQFPNAHAAGWSDPSFFPFGVFLSPAQDPHAANLAAAGINYYEGIEANLGNIESALAAGIAVIPQYTEFTPDEVDAENGDNNPLVVGWHVDDEPDMFRDLDTVTTRVAIIEEYDDGRFTRLNIGKGITGSALWSPTTTDDMVRAVDVATCDMYFYSSSGVRHDAVTSSFWTGPGLSDDEALRSAAYGWVADRLASFQDAEEKKPYGVTIETAKPLLGEDEPWITLPQISGATWSSIRHGSRIILFFQHNNNDIDPFYSISDEDSTVIRGHITALTTEVASLAAVIDGPTYEWDFGDDDVETMLKAYGDDAYIFAGVALNAAIGGGESDIEQTGTTLQFQFAGAAATGTVSSAITVPDNTELVVVAVSGYQSAEDGFDAMTFTKGGVDTAMTRATTGPTATISHQAAIFTLVLPDTGSGKSLKWSWLGATSSGLQIVAVTFWQGLDLSEPVRDSNGVQATDFPLETPTSVVTPALAAADGDKMLALCGMYNSAADGAAKVNVWTHAVSLEELTHSGFVEGALATGTPDGDATIGFENISHATQAALVGITMKAATLEAVTSTVEQTGAIFSTSTGGSSGNTGTFFALATVPADCTFALAAVHGFTGLADGYLSLTMPKGGVDTAMVRLSGGDEDESLWQAAMFYMVNPDVGASKAIKWDLIGSSSATLGSQLSIVFLKGVDTTTPVRDNAGIQTSDFPVETPMLTNREGDLVLAFFGGSTDASAEGSVDSWKNVTLLEQGTHDGFYDQAWGSAAVIGSMKVGVNTVSAFNGGALVAAVIKPSAAVTPITPAADPPTVARTVVTGTFTLPPDLTAATTVEVIGESRSISVTAGAFTDTFDEEWSYHNYRIAIP